MSDRYPFTGDKLVTHDGTVVWSEQAPVQSSLHFTNVSDATLSDSMNDSYATAVDDNETQYLSVLETTNDITLEDLHNLTLGNPKMAVQENLAFDSEGGLENLDVNAVDMADQQVVVFTVDGSDDLYGIQFAQDDEGNMQKYQFKFRTTEDGQLEAIPETIQLLPNDEDVTQKDSEVLVQEVEDEETAAQETEAFFQKEQSVDETLLVQEEEDNTLEPDDSRLHIYIKGEPERQSPELQQEEEAVDDQQYVEEQEAVVEQSEEQELQYEETETEETEDQFQDETIDIKTGILEENLAASNIKQELYQEDANQSDDVENEEYDNMYKSPEDITKDMQYVENHLDDIQEEHIEQGDVDNYVEVDDAHETVLEYQQFVSGDIEQVFEETTTDSQSLQPDDNHYEQLFIQENHIRQVSKVKTAEAQPQVNAVDELEGHFVTETCAENDSDNDDYQIVEGLHITAEGDISEGSPPGYQEPETILQEVVEKPAVTERVNILKQTSVMKSVKDGKGKTKTLVYYVVPHVEKENVNSLPVNNTTTTFQQIRTNPRSILKSSFPDIKEEQDIKTVVDERLNKRFARSKEAVQARLFNNFISKTTIPHAPVRQTRLPRKQEIKPVDTRRDEEIIVQEVMVSSNGFVENVEEKLRNKDKLEVTGYVVLTDSDDDYDPKQANRKKKKHKKLKKVDMSDSDESDVSVIEIFPSDEEEEEARKEQESPKRGRGRPRKSVDAAEKTDSMKRRRGRPPKGQAQSETEDSPQKKSRTESDEIESDNAKKEIKCPHCTKTFPSPNSLSTHIQHHNLENSLRNSQVSKARKSVAIEYKHKCDACQTTFKNSILLKRHVCAKALRKPAQRLDCSLCKKSFPDLSALNIHKRSHVKENLVKTTTVAKITPKKFLPRPSTSKVKSPKKLASATSEFKCKVCARIWFSQDSLNLHEKTHAKFTCRTCNKSFASRILLDTHVRVHCVKNSSPVTRRLSFKVRKSFMHSPSRKTTFARKSLKPRPNTTLNLRSTTLNKSLECHCGEKFASFQETFKHQVTVHGVETPDKSVLAEEEKTLHQPMKAHGGIRQRAAMQKIFANLKNKITTLTPAKNFN